MPVTINEVHSDIRVDPGSPRAMDHSPNPAPEVRIEELRAIVHELLVEELERYFRTVVER
jgi:hypothetical protein